MAQSVLLNALQTDAAFASWFGSTSGSRSAATSSQYLRAGLCCSDSSYSSRSFWLGHSVLEWPECWHGPGSSSSSWDMEWCLYARQRLRNAGAASPSKWAPQAVPGWTEFDVGSQGDEPILRPVPIETKKGGINSRPSLFSLLLLTYTAHSPSPRSSTYLTVLLQSMYVSSDSRLSSGMSLNSSRIGSNDSGPTRAAKSRKISSSWRSAL